MVALPVSQFSITPNELMELIASALCQLLFMYTWAHTCPYRLPLENLQLPCTYRAGNPATLQRAIKRCEWSQQFHFLFFRVFNAPYWVL